jgi:hypothetical protein
VRHIHTVFKVGNESRPSLTSGPHTIWVSSNESLYSPTRMTEDFVIKYFWSAVGYGLMSIPVFFPGIRNAMSPGADGTGHTVASRTEGKAATMRQLTIRLRRESTTLAVPGRRWRTTDVLGEGLSRAIRLHQPCLRFARFSPCSRQWFICAKLPTSRIVALRSK